MIIPQAGENRHAIFEFNHPNEPCVSSPPLIQLGGYRRGLSYMIVRGPRQSAPIRRRSFKHPRGIASKGYRYIRPFITRATSISSCLAALMNAICPHSCLMKLRQSALLRNTTTWSKQQVHYSFPGTLQPRLIYCLAWLGPTSSYMQLGQNCTSLQRVCWWVNGVI